MIATPPFWDAGWAALCEDIMTRTSPKKAPGHRAASASRTLTLAAAEKVLGLSVASARERFSELTDREQEVARLMAAGKRNRQIAEDLGISPKTLDIHRANAMHKLRTETTAALANLVNLLKVADLAH
jgi:FixJ family two-component response regulator